MMNAIEEPHSHGHRTRSPKPSDIFELPSFAQLSNTMAVGMSTIETTMAVGMEEIGKGAGQALKSVNKATKAVTDATMLDKEVEKAGAALNKATTVASDMASDVRKTVSSTASFLIFGKRASDMDGDTDEEEYRVLMPRASATTAANITIASQPQPPSLKRRSSSHSSVDCELADCNIDSPCSTSAAVLLVDDDLCCSPSVSGLSKRRQMNDCVCTDRYEF